MTIAGINIEFSRTGYFQRINKYFIYALLAGLISFGIMMLKIEPPMTADDLLLSICVSVFLSISVILNTLYQNIYYLLKLKVDQKYLEISYMRFNKEVLFRSDLNDLEFVRKQTISRHPTPFLIIRKDEDLVLRLFTSVNQELNEEKMEKLIRNLSELKKDRFQIVNT